MRDDRENKVLGSARESLDQSVEQMPEDLSAKLAAARAKAMASAENPDGADLDSKVVSIQSRIDKNRLVWGGAIAASCAALTLTLALWQPSGEDFLLLDGEGSYALDAENSMLILTEMDNTEWELVQELEFALWLSEFGDEASATDFSG